MPVLKAGHVDLYYEMQGEGFPMLLIRGVGSNADHWYAQVPAFSERFMVVTFDNRGTGRSGKPPGPYSIREMAADTAGLMKALSIDKAHVLGLSMGGMIAQELALRYPERVAGLILAATHFGGTKKVAPRPEIQNLFKDMVYKGSEEAKQKAAVSLFAPSTLKNRPEVAERYLEVSLKYPVSAEVLIRQWEAVIAHDTWDDLPKISSPTLVITGDQDALIPPENSKKLADRIPGARLVIVAGGGHQFFIEQADAANRTILDFLGKWKS